MKQHDEKLYSVDVSGSRKRLPIIKDKKIKAFDFDNFFDEGDVIEYLDLKSVKMHYPQ